MATTHPAGKKWRVLIADDVHETRRSTRLMLSAFDNMEVVAIASNGAQAVAMTKEQRPDIVLMDVNMPEMDGLTAFGQIAKIFPDIACIIISAENDAITLNTAEVLGVQAYLTKPFILDDLEKALTHVTRRLEELRGKLPPLPDIAQLEQLAAVYSKARRTDDEAVKVFELLVRDPRCHIRWLKTLALMYTLRQDWQKLKLLAERLERADHK